MIGDEQPAFYAAPEGAFWWRHLLFERELNNFDTLKYVETKLVSPENPRPWAKELSIRVSALAESIVDFAEKKAAEVNERRGLSGARAAAFRGLFFAEVAISRRLENWDVFVDPIDDDDAHSNLVVYTAGLDAEGKADFDDLRSMGMTYCALHSQAIAELEDRLGPA